MRIFESCENWVMEYNNVLLQDLDKDSDEYKILAAILHLSGDVIALYTNVPKTIADDSRNNILSMLSAIFSDAKEQVVQCIDQVLSIDAYQSPLDPDFSNETIFGVDLKETLQANLRNQAEEQIANTHFQILDDSVEEDDEDNDDKIL